LPIAALPMGIWRQGPGKRPLNQLIPSSTMFPYVEFRFFIASITPFP
jgi:hypothetical protein